MKCPFPPGVAEHCDIVGEEYDQQSEYLRLSLIYDKTRHVMDQMKQVPQRTERRLGVVL